VFIGQGGLNITTKEKVMKDILERVRLAEEQVRDAYLPTLIGHHRLACRAINTAASGKWIEFEEALRRLPPGASKFVRSVCNESGLSKETAA
jgi:hypothetical protein